MANDLRDAITSVELNDTDQLKKGTDKLGYDFSALPEEDILNVVWEILKPLQAQQRELHAQISEIHGYIKKAFGRDSDNASSQGATGARGIQGIKGDTGSQGIQGVKGDTGNSGSDGSDAVVSGHTGTQAFLTSTRGATKTLTIKNGLITGIK